jgi:hypothetical protein
MGAKVVKTTECDKLVAASKVSQEIGAFLDWLEEQGIFLASDEEVEGRRGRVTLPVYESKERMFARYFEIDLDKVENERRALLASLRS